MESRDRSLYYFSLVADELNISAVAKKLFISQQALSKHIQRLEDDFGVQLFIREPRLQLTGEGQRVFNYAKRVLAEEQGLRNSLTEDRLNTTRYPIGLATDCGEVLVSGIFDRFRFSRPDITLAFSPCGYSDIIYLLKQGRIKVAVGMLHAFSKYCTQTPLMDEDLYFVLREDLFWKLPEELKSLLKASNGVGVSLDDIARCELPLVTPWRASYIGNTLMTRFHQVDHNVEVVAEAVSCGETMQLCTAGYCAAFAHRSQLYSNLSRCMAAKLYIFPIRDLGMACTLGLAYSEELRNDPLFMDFVQIAKEAADSVVRDADAALGRYRRTQFPR